MDQFDTLDEEHQKKNVLRELYTLTDEYNQYIRNMDARLDIVLSKMEKLNENGNVWGVVGNRRRSDKR